MKNKIICFHGLHQNKNIFLKKLSPVIQFLQNQNDVSFKFLEGPIAVLPRILLTKKSNLQKTGSTKKKAIDPEIEYRGWWNPWSSDKDVWIALAPLLKELETEDCSGIWGFSQGAALAHLICTEDISKQLNWKPKLVIFSSGFISKTSFLGKCYAEDRLIQDVNTMHIYGKTDQVIPPAKSIELLKAFEKHSSETQCNISEYVHGQGHTIPSNDIRMVKKIESFIQKTL